VRPGLARGLTVPQAVITWLTSLPADLVPIVGTGRPAHLMQLTEAADVELTPQELGSLTI
jgi:predicted oxidoreductase